LRRNDYLQGDVARFCEWLSQRLEGHPIHFSIAGYNRQFSTLQDALNAYSWPLKKVSGRPNPDGSFPYIHPTVPTLVANSTLAANSAVLDVIQKALRAAYFNVQATSNALAGAVAATLHWGGVYTTTRHGGNKLWLAQNHVNLLSVLQNVVNDHALGDDVSGVTALRFNAGMTKVYSLLIDDFIIYDSRVAAALAWLALKWWMVVKGKSQSQLHEHLRFLCLPGNGKAQKLRNPAPSLFTTHATKPYEHYKWNVRANWLLHHAQGMAGTNSRFSSLREVEAALFQMGERVI
jgi:hypothetical protein